MLSRQLENLNTELTAARDKLEEAHDAQHRFFAQMSHELRTPLNGIIGISESLYEQIFQINLY